MNFKARPAGAIFAPSVTRSWPVRENVAQKGDFANILRNNYWVGYFEPGHLKACAPKECASIIEVIDIICINMPY